MPRNTPSSISHATPLSCATTVELIAELKRRSLGCMLACVRAEEDGDAWHYALKGSPILLGAMSAALSLQTSHRLKTLTSRDSDGTPMEV